MAFITDTIHSSTPRHLNAHQTTSLGTLSKAFSKSTKAIQSSLFLARYFSCSWRTMNNCICCAFPGHKTKLHAINFHTTFLTLLSMTLSRIFMSMLLPILFLCTSHIPVHLPSPCKHSPTNSYSNPLGFYHP